MVKITNFASSIGVAVFGEGEVLDKRRRSSRNLNAETVLRNFSATFSSSSSSLDVDFSESFSTSNTLNDDDEFRDSEDDDSINGSQHEHDSAATESSQFVHAAFGDYESLRAKVAARYALPTPKAATGPTSKHSLIASASTAADECSIGVEDRYEVDDSEHKNKETLTNPRRYSSRRSSRLSVSSISLNLSISKDTAVYDDEQDSCSFNLPVRHQSFRRSNSIVSKSTRRSSRSYPKFELDHLFPNQESQCSTTLTTVDATSSVLSNDED